MNIQDLLNLAIQALFWITCCIICFDFSLYITIYWTGEIETSSPRVNLRKEPQSLDELKADGVYNFGLALALSDLE